MRHEPVFLLSVIGPTGWGECGGMVSSEPIVEAMGFAPAMISLRKEAEVEEGFRGVGGNGEWSGHEREG